MFHARLNDVINALFDEETEMGYKMSLAQTFFLIGKEHPEQITATQVDRLFARVEDGTCTTHELYQIFHGLSFVANAKPHLFDKHYPILIRFITEQQSAPAMTCLQQYLVASTIMDGEEKANESVLILMNLLKKDDGISNDIRELIFYGCQLIGVIHIKALAAKRDDLISLNSYPACRRLIDLIDGNKLNEENQAAINKTREMIAQIQKRVIKTDIKVENVTKMVKQQESNVSFVNHFNENRLFPY